MSGALVHVVCIDAVPVAVFDNLGAANKFANDRHMMLGKIEIWTAPIVHGLRGYHTLTEKDGGQDG